MTPRYVQSFVLLVVAVLTATHASAQSASGTSRPGRVNIGPLLPQLVTTARFVDSDSSGALDGLETAQLEVVVENRGEGVAKGVTVVAESDTASVAVGAPTAVGELAPGAQRKLVVPLQAAVSTESGKVAITLRTREADGNDAQRIQVNVLTRRVERPGLEITSIRLNDKTGGLARGNGNGIVENGETVEVVVSLRNAALGEARGLLADVTSTTKGAQVVSGRADIPQLLGGAAAEMRFAVSVPVDIDAVNLAGKVQVRDGRGLGATSRDFSLPIQKLVPRLTFEIAVRDGDIVGTKGNRNGVAEFGETVGIEVTAANGGTRDAEDVRATISTGGFAGLVIQRLDSAIGTIPAGERAAPLTFFVTVQNSAAAGAAQLPVELTQRTFAPVKQLVRLDVRDPGDVIVNAGAEPGPKVDIISPQGGATVSAGQDLRLWAQVAGQRVARVEVLVDGNVVPNTARVPDTLVDVREMLTVKSGRHTILVRVVDTSSRVTEKEVQFSVAALGGAGDLVQLRDVPISRARRDPNAYAVVVGISQYRENLPAAEFAAEDAIEVKRFLEGVVGIEPQHIRLLTNEKATRSDIEEAIEDWLPRVATSPSAKVFVYFSGHGTPSDPSEGAAGSPLLVPYEGAPGQSRKLYSVATLYGALGRLKSSQVHVWIDACFSGLGERTVARAGTRGSAYYGPRNRGDLSEMKGNTAALLASGGDQYANVWRDAGHGLFTYYLLRGLAGEADQDKGGSVTVGELYSFLTGPVERQAGSLGSRQTPVLLPVAADDARRGWVLSLSSK